MKKALLVGAGGMGKTWARNLAAHPDVELAAWVDIAPGAAEAAAAATGLTVPFLATSLDAALATEVDFVVDVTFPEAHPRVTIESLKAGKPVLGEKPMAPTLPEARSMIEASESAGKLFMVSQSRRYDGGIHAYRDLIRQNLGRLGILNADFYIGAHFGGFRDQMASPLVLDMAIHTFDAARFITGADPVAVYAEEFNPSWSWYKGDACATVIFEMSGGLRFTYRGSWCAEGCKTEWESNWRAVGERGTALWDGSSGINGEVLTGDVEGFLRPLRPIRSPPSEVKPQIEGSLQEFLDALEGGPTPNGECHDNIKSLAMVLSAIESAKSCQRLLVEV